MNVHSGGDLKIDSPGGLIECLREVGNGALEALCVRDVSGFAADDPEIWSLPKPTPTKSSRRNRLKARSFFELQSLTDPKWIVPDMVPDDALVVLYGKPKRGKSFIALDLSLCVASGAPFHETAIGRTGRVLYVAAEGGAAAIRNRVRAWLKANNVDANKIAGHVVFG